jgi:hypothetical protein
MREHALAVDPTSYAVEANVLHARREAGAGGDRGCQLAVGDGA